MARVAIIGSRRWRDRDAIGRAVAALETGDVVVSGGAKGPDTWAAAAARARGLEVVEHRPDLAGVKARWAAAERYYARNQRVVDDCDRVIAFVAADRKGGTEDTIRRAAKAGKPIDVIAPA